MVRVKIKIVGSLYNTVQTIYNGLGWIGFLFHNWTASFRRVKVTGGEHKRYVLLIHLGIVASLWETWVTNPNQAVLDALVCLHKRWLTLQCEGVNWWEKNMLADLDSVQLGLALVKNWRKKTSNGSFGLLVHTVIIEFNYIVSAVIKLEKLRMPCSAHWRAQKNWSSWTPLVDGTINRTPSTRLESLQIPSAENRRSYQRIEVAKRVHLEKCCSRTYFVRRL